MSRDLEKQKNKQRKLALEYHIGNEGKPGKLEINATKSLVSQRDLSLAYSPGVAEPCKEIEKDPNASYLYTARGNLVAVVTNGSAVLGLGDIGPLASKPVMEGKAVLFKKFADLDCFDIELKSASNEAFIGAVQALEPTFGGINLEDIKAPDCFEIERRLKESMDIPVFHDDQHGTAIISGAALLNALEVSAKKIDQVKVVFCGGGAASISCARFWLSLGVRPENCIMTDRNGVIYEGRDQELNPYKGEFALKKPPQGFEKMPKTLAEAVAGADVFLGCSVAGALSKEMLASMAKNPIVFALANPDPEIAYEDAYSVREDMIFATGRSDYPNQINNVLCFPFMFRGALDVRASAINEEMKIAAARALAQLSKEQVPETVLNAYGVPRLEFGKSYVIPKPLDPRALLWVAPAVAEAAIRTGVARTELPGGSLESYRLRLEKILGKRHTVMRDLRHRVHQVKSSKSQLVRILFPEGHNDKILKAAAIVREEKIAEPVFLADPKKFRELSERLNVSELLNCEIIRPRHSEHFNEYVESFYQLRARKGVTLDLARQLLKDPFYFGAMHLRFGRVDACLAGISRNYPETIRPHLQSIGSTGGHRVSGVYMHIWKNRVVFLADTTVNIHPSAQDLADIACDTADLASNLGFEPRVAMLSFSNFGSNEHPDSLRVREATALIQQRRPDLMVDGEMQADVAVNADILEETFSFTKFRKGCSANVLIFPNLAAANISYKLLGQLGGAEMVGPILVGMKEPVHILQRSAGVNEIVNMAVIAALDAQQKTKDQQTLT